MAKAAKTLPPQDPLTAGRRALHKRRNAAQDRRDALGLLGRVVVLAAAAWVLFTQVFLLTQASGNSMFPGRQGRRPAHRLPAAGHLRQERRGALRAGRQAPGGPCPGPRERPHRTGRFGNADRQRLGPERRDPLPHLRERHPRVPLHRPRGQRLHLGRLPHAIRGQPGFWPGGPHRRQSKGDHPAAAAELVSY